MKRQWTTEEPLELWSLEPDDKSCSSTRRKRSASDSSRSLPSIDATDASPTIGTNSRLACLFISPSRSASPVTTISAYRWHDRTGRRHRVWILKRLGVGRFDDEAKKAFEVWLMTEALPREPKAGALEEWISAWLARAKVDRPAADRNRFDRLVRATRRRYEEQVFEQVLARLDEGMRHRLDELLGDGGEETPFNRLRGDAGRISLESLLEEVEKLQAIRKLGPPADILKPFHPDLIKRYRRRAATESAWQLRHEHPARIRLALLTFYCVRREAEIVDALVELLVQIAQKITRKAERRVEKEFLAAGTMLRASPPSADRTLGPRSGAMREAHDMWTSHHPPRRRSHTVVYATARRPSVPAWFGVAKLGCATRLESKRFAQRCHP